jgi:hypothetical protein
MKNISLRSSPRAGRLERGLQEEAGRRQRHDAPLDNLERLGQRKPQEAVRLPISSVECTADIAVLSVRRFENAEIYVSEEDAEPWNRRTVRG